jgi:hypothetical protein
VIRKLKNTLRIEVRQRPDIFEVILKNQPPISHIMHRYPKVIIFVALAALVAACATFYQKTYQVQSNIADGNFETADRLLANDTKWAENNHRVLYYMNRGVVSFMMGDHNKSIGYLNQADYYIEDFSKQMGWEALSIVSNPMVKPYRPEDFEAIMVHFYKALNFLSLDDLEGALVEARRVNIKLQQLNDQYKDHKNKYQRDAFAHNLMGMLYEAAGEYNNAFIAYRNALEIYETDYTKLFGMKAPLQLKKDLLRSARQTGFSDQVAHYEREFGIKAPDIRDKKNGELVIFWLNGMGPVKEEWQITISNFGMSNDPFFSKGEIIYSGNTAYFEKAQDINQIAFQSLRDRMVRELGGSLLRLATKRAMEELASRENKNLGTIVSIINAMTEKADTRNWQSLP